MGYSMGYDIQWGIIHIILISSNNIPIFYGLVSGKIYRKAPYLIGKSLVSCRFSLEPIH
jgi:hypothetical protein